MVCVLVRNGFVMECVGMGIMEALSYRQHMWVWSVAFARSEHITNCNNWNKPIKCVMVIFLNLINFDNCGEARN